jgi:hypothetical protein
MQDYKQDIIATRMGGLGSSDAKMVEKIGKIGSLSYADRERIAEMLGKVERRQFTTAATALGDTIENQMYDIVKGVYPQAVSNPYYKSKLSEEYGFDIFNHIDYEAETDTHLIWVEQKASKHSTDRVRKDYDAQLKWHWMLLCEKAESIGKKPELRLCHYHTDEDTAADFNADNLCFLNISFRKGYDDSIKKGLAVISAALPDFEFVPKEELDATDLPEELQNAMVLISDKLSQMRALEAEIGAFEERCREIFEANNVKSIRNDLFTITYTAAHESTRFDSKSLEKDLPETYQKYLKTTQVKSSVTIKLKN